MVVFVAAKQFAGFGVPSTSSSSCGVRVRPAADWFRSLPIARGLAAPLAPNARAGRGPRSRPRHRLPPQPRRRHAPPGVDAGGEHDGGGPRGAHRRRVRGTPRPPAASEAARNAGGSGKQHYAAITDPKEVSPLLRLLDGYAGTLPVRCALWLAPLVFMSPGELIKAEWAGIDLEGAEWRYTVTKTGTPHIVPLARQAVAILREVHSLTGHGRYVFPNARYPHRERPMSHATLWSTFRALDIPRDRMTLHGFRAMARTILDEVLGFRPDFIEHQLAHEVRDPNGRAYNRTAFLPERRVMMHPRPIPDVRLGHTPTRHLPRVPQIP